MPELNAVVVHCELLLNSHIHTKQPVMLHQQKKHKQKKWQKIKNKKYANSKNTTRLQKVKQNINHTKYSTC